jgi:hypothetical protein
MRRGEVFWGVLLVILGGLFLLEAAGYMTGGVFGWFWPLCIIAAGAWILLGGFRQRDSSPSTNSFEVPLQGAREARLTINHGVGRVQLREGSASEIFLTGTAAAAMDHSSRLIGDRLEVEVDAGPSVFPLIGPEGGTWEYRLNPQVPTALSVQAGASQLELDLSKLQITHFKFEGGACSLSFSLPSDVPQVMVELEAGAASLRLHVPDGVAIRFRNKGVGSVKVDEKRFPRTEAGVYASADYDSAPRRADIVLDGGATSLELS